MNTRFSNIAIEYLRKNKKVCETVFENLSKSKLHKHIKRGPDGLQSQKEGKKFRDTVPFYQ